MSEDFDYGLGSFSQEDISSDLLGRVGRLAKELQERKDVVSGLEEQAKLEKQNVRKLETVTLPEAMQEVGLSEVTTNEGFKVKVEPLIEVNLSEERRELGLKWLRENEHAGIIRNTLTVTFNTNEEDSIRARKLLEELTGRGFDVESKETVHPATLKKWAREEVEAGNEPPRDIFATFIGSIAKLSKKKGT